METGSTSQSRLLLGTSTGTLLGVIGNTSGGDLFKTALLAAVGAAVSYLVSLALRWLVGRFTKKP